MPVIARLVPSKTRELDEAISGVRAEGDCHAEFTLSYARFFAEPVLRNSRSFSFTEFTLSDTRFFAALRMTQSEGLAMGIYAICVVF